MARTWNTTYHLFNDSIIPSGESRADRFYPESRRLVTGLAEARRIRATRQYWTVDLSNLLLSPRQLQQIRAAERRSLGIAYPVLMRIASWCRIEDEPDNVEPTPRARIGTGTGSLTTFQLQKTYDDGQGYSATEVISFPYWQYPAWTDINDGDWVPFDDLRIYVDGTERTSGWTVDRESGVVTFTSSTPAAGKAVEATGGFLTKMLMPGHLAVKFDGPLYRIAENVQMIEPYED